jgi:hypothetical protein
MKTSKLCSVVFLALVVVLFVAPARATITLTDENSTLSINPTSSAGMYSWIVDGVQQLDQQWYWISIGNGLAEPVNALGLMSAVPVAPNIEDLTYGSAGGVQVVLSLTLYGDPVGTGLSDLDTNIRVENTSTTSSKTVHFFEYSNFELNGVLGGQSVLITGSGVNTATQTSALGSVSESVVGPNPTGYEAALYPTILNGLNTVSGYTLNDVTTAGPGDATWAFEWDKTLTIPSGHGNVLAISKDESLSVVVPEPATIFGMGVILLAVGRKLRKTR